MSFPVKPRWCARAGLVAEMRKRARNTCAHQPSHATRLPGHRVRRDRLPSPVALRYRDSEQRSTDSSGQACQCVQGTSWTCCVASACSPDAFYACLCTYSRVSNTFLCVFLLTPIELIYSFRLLMISLTCWAKDHRERKEAIGRVDAYEGNRVTLYNYGDLNCTPFHNELR